MEKKISHVKNITVIEFENEKCIIKLSKLDGSKNHAIGTISHKIEPVHMNVVDGFEEGNIMLDAPVLSKTWEKINAAVNDIQTAWKEIIEETKK